MKERERCDGEIKVRAPQELVDILGGLAAREDRSLSDLVRKVLSDWVYGQAPKLRNNRPDD